MVVLPQNPTIVLIRFSAAGDVVLCTALPRLIKKRYPNARVVFVTKAAYAPLLQSNPHISEVLGLETKQGMTSFKALIATLQQLQPDLVVDLHNSLRSRWLRAQLKTTCLIYNKRNTQRWMLLWARISFYPAAMPHKLDDFLAPLAAYGVENDQLGTQISTEAQQQHCTTAFPEEWKRLQAWRAGRHPVIGIAPVAKWHLKCWPLAHVKALVSKYLHATQGEGGVILFGGVEDAQPAQLQTHFGDRVLNLAGRTSLLESAWWASQCDLLVCNDSAMLHIAEAVNVAVIALFGPTTRAWGYFPHHAQSQVLERTLACRPCSLTGKGSCSHPWQQACLRGISPDTVWQAIEEKLMLSL